MAVSQALMESREREDFQASLVFQVAQGFQEIKVTPVVPASLEIQHHHLLEPSRVSLVLQVLMVSQVSLDQQE